MKFIPVATVHPSIPSLPLPSERPAGDPSGSAETLPPIGVGGRLLWRLACFLIRHVYRIRIEGARHLPRTGGALLVSNHLSMVDACLVGAICGRHVRFLMFEGMYERFWLRPFVRLAGVIPISSNQGPRELIHSLRRASAAIRQGELVCIFAEGQVTRTGQMMPFRPGFTRIMKDTRAPIIPVGLDAVWGSIFSFEKQRFVWKLPKRLPFPVSITFGEPLPGDASPVAVRQAVQELAPGAWGLRKSQMVPLHRAFIRTARGHPFRFALADSATPPLGWMAALARTLFLARRLHRHWEGQEMVGILLPPSVGAALVNYAALLMGKVPVNLNYTCSDATLAACAAQCGVKTVVTSQAFLAKAGITLPGTAIMLEEIAAHSGALEKLGCLLRALVLPAGALERAAGRTRQAAMDDLATVIFSSGSTGEPKGVMLSHFNIAANAVQLGQVFGLGSGDRFLGSLPFFHSFGFTGTLCLGPLLGVGVAYQANPLDSAAIGALVRTHHATFLLTTPTFLQMYLRSCPAEDFGSLRIILTGAEKLPDRLAEAVERKFGLRPLEGYGCTECAPAVAVNSPDFRAAGIHQVGSKRGTIGHPLPGVCVRIVDPVGLGPVPPGQPGLMLVRGPNVMQGYVGRPDCTSEVLLPDPDGNGPWYVTGDIVTRDEDGFLTITDRLSRFSKIGGEMVPHIKVEETLHASLGVTERRFVVTSVPDDRKGERLVVLHLVDEVRLTACLERFAACDLPNLWKPKADAFVRVPAFPMLGTGKLDLQAARQTAHQAAAFKARPGA